MNVSLLLRLFYPLAPGLSRGKPDGAILIKKRSAAWGKLRIGGYAATTPGVNIALMLSLHSVVKLHQVFTMPEVGFELGANDICEKAGIAEAEAVRIVNVPKLGKVWRWRV